MKMRLYRYMKFEHAAQSLRDGFFKLGQPSKFNDPFECRGRFINMDVPLRKHIHADYERLRFECIRRTNANTQELQARFTEDYIYETYFGSVDKLMGNSWLDAVDATVFMICFVNAKGFKQHSDVLFWSHYANAGDGVRITFDLEKKPDRGIYYMKDVEYTDDIPIFDCSKMEGWLKGPEFQDYIERLSHTKGKAWEYENEVRMIYPRRLPFVLPNGVKHVRERVIGGQTLYFAKIGFDAISRIDYGPKVDKPLAAKVIAELRGRGETAHIHHFETLFDANKYVYTYKRVA